MTLKRNLVMTCNTKLYTSTSANKENKNGANQQELFTAHATIVVTMYQPT